MIYLKFKSFKPRSHNTGQQVAVPLIKGRKSKYVKLGSLIDCEFIQLHYLLCYVERMNHERKKESRTSEEDVGRSG